MKNAQPFRRWGPFFAVPSPLLPLFKFWCFCLLFSRLVADVTMSWALRDKWYIVTQSVTGSWGNIFSQFCELKFKGFLGIARVRIIQSVSFRHQRKVRFICRPKATQLFPLVDVNKVTGDRSCTVFYGQFRVFQVFRALAKSFTTTNVFSTKGFKTGGISYRATEYSLILVLNT